MTGIEILLLVIGVIFFVASFFIAEKLSPGELNKIGELSNDEIQRVMERELQKVSGDIEGKVEEKVEEALVNSERSMEKECNEKIMAISEYSDTVVESMNKTHNEIMFLYSMLNDKHTELTQFSSKLQELVNELEKKDEEIEQHMLQRSVAEEAMTIPQQLEEPADMQDDWADELAGSDLEEPETMNYNSAILALHKEGKTAIEIARELALGLGEVQLVIGLYEGKRKK
ncbi:MAG: DUF6115 domain-containing protein [Lachnospiraceae bacterium]